MNQFTDNMNGGYTNVSAYVSPSDNANQSIFSNIDIPMIEHDGRQSRANPTIGDCAEARAERFEQRYFNVEETERQPVVDEIPSQDYEQDFDAQDQLELDKQNAQEFSLEIPFIEENADDQIFGKQQSLFNQIDNSKQAFESQEKTDLDNFSLEINENEQPAQSNLTTNRRIREIFDDNTSSDTASQSIGYTSRVEADSNQSSRPISMFSGESVVNSSSPIEKEKPKKAPPINRRYYRPPFELLEDYVQPMNAGQENHEERKQIIQRTLEEFHINAVPQGHIQGPSVTRYEIMMPAGISVKKVLNYDDDLKMRLSAKNGVRIEAPIPGKNLVGIEVANTIKVTVG